MKVMRSETFKDKPRLPTPSKPQLSSWTLLFRPPGPKARVIMKTDAAGIPKQYRYKIEPGTYIEFSV
jgi:hypothetical protein